GPRQQRRDRTGAEGHRRHRKPRRTERAVLHGAYTLALSLSILMNCFKSGVLSCHVRALTMLPSTTQLRSTYTPPNAVTSRAHFATVVRARTLTPPAAATIWTP